MTQFICMSLVTARQDSGVHHALLLTCWLTAHGPRLRRLRPSLALIVHQRHHQVNVGPAAALGRNPRSHVAAIKDAQLQDPGRPHRAGRAFRDARRHRNVRRQPAGALRRVSGAQPLALRDGVGELLQPQ